MTLAERLALAMKARNVTAGQVEQRLRERGGEVVTRTTIWFYCTGKTSPTAALLLDLAAVLDVPPAWLLTGDTRDLTAGFVIYIDAAREVAEARAKL